MSLAQRLIQHGLHVALHALLHLPGHIQLGHGLLADIVFFIVIRIVQNPAGLIHHGNIFRQKPLDAPGCQVDNALDFLLVQLHIRAQLQHDGCRSRLFILLVKAVLRQHDMHPGLFHGCNLLDGAGKLPLQCLQVVYLVLELRHAQLAVIKNLKALVAPRQAFRRQAQPCLVHIGSRYQYRGALLRLLNLIINLGLLQLGCHLAGILCLHVGKQRHHVRLAAKGKAGCHNGNYQHHYTADSHIMLPFRQPAPELQVFFFQITHYQIPLLRSNNIIAMPLKIIPAYA